MPGPLQAGARGSPPLPARPQPAASRRPRPLTEPGAPGGGGNKELWFLPRTRRFVPQPRGLHCPPRARPVSSRVSGHGGLRAAAAALGLLRGGRRWVATLPGPHPPSFAPVFPTSGLGDTGGRRLRAPSSAPKDEMSGHVPPPFPRVSAV